MVNALRNTAVILSACTALAGAPALADRLSATTDIRFSGSSTLHDFEGVAAARPFVADFEQDSATGIMKVSARTSLTVQDMTTDNRKRDRNMYRMFDTDHFKLIEAALTNAVVTDGEPTKAILHLKIRNVEKDVVAELHMIEHSKDGIICSMCFPVSLKAFDLETPSVLGMIKVADTVLVECTITGVMIDPSTEG